MTFDGTAKLETNTRRDWRIWFGLGATVLWLWLGFLYIGGVVGWGNFVRQPSEALGGFLEGAFAPLAFLWLVIGYFLQKGALAANNEAIRMQYEEMRRATAHAEVQAQAISMSALHQRQETFLLVADRVHRQLGAIVGLLYISSQSDPAVPSSAQTLGDLWERAGSGDPEAFGRQFIALHFRTLARGESSYELFYGTDVRRRHTEAFLESFERMLRSARECDPDGIITDALRGSAHGYLYRIISEHRASPPA